MLCDQPAGVCEEEKREEEEEEIDTMRERQTAVYIYDRNNIT